MMIDAMARLAELADPEHRAQVSPDALLLDVLDDIARTYCLPCAAEELAGRDVLDRDASAWQTFGDVLAWIAGARADQQNCGEVLPGV